MSRRSVPAALLVAGALALSGCATGLDAQTYKQVPYREFRDTTVGDLKVRNLAISAPKEDITIPADGEAVLTGTFVNTGTEADALVGVETPLASETELQVDGVTVSSVPAAPGADSGTTWSVVLRGLTQELRSGEYVEVVLTFQKAGATQPLQVPVRSGDTGLAEREAAQDPYGGHGGGGESEEHGEE